MMYANDLATGRNHYTADRATLKVFGECARTELHWNDGALVRCVFDTVAEARQYLRERGFDA